MTTMERPRTQAATPEAPEKPAAPPTRRVVTGEELELRYTSWSQQRREQREARSPEQKRSTSRRNLLIATGLVVAGIAGGSAWGTSQIRGTAAENAFRIHELSTEVDAADAAVPADGETAQNLEVLRSLMESDGEKVASLQQDFAGLYREASMAGDAGNGAPSPQMLAIPEHRRTLAPLFTDATFVVGDEAYAWSTADSGDVGESIDPRYAWYVRYDEDGRASAPEASTWKVESAFPELGTSDATAGVGSQGTVVWTCRDTATGQILAWASGTYGLDTVVGSDEPSGRFASLRVTISEAGMAHQPSTNGGQA